jgi:hypothetical protein
MNFKVLALALLLSVSAQASEFIPPHCYEILSLHEAEDFALAPSLSLVFSAESKTGVAGLKAFRTGDKGLGRIPVTVTHWTGQPLQSHGIDFFDGEAKTLFVVNRASDTVELFEVISSGLPVEKIELRYKSTVISTLIRSPNDVRAISAHEFFVSNDMLNILSQTGNLVFCRGKNCKIVRDKIHYANGLASRREGSSLLLFNSETLENAIQVYTVGKGGKLTPKYRINLPFGPDNLQFDTVGDLWVAALPKPANIAFGLTGPSAVFRLRQKSPGHWARKLQLFTNGEMINSGTGAVGFDGHFLVTSVHDSKSYWCR